MVHSLIYWQINHSQNQRQNSYSFNQRQVSDSHSWNNLLQRKPPCRVWQEEEEVTAVSITGQDVWSV